MLGVGRRLVKVADSSYTKKHPEAHDISVLAAISTKPCHPMFTIHLMKATGLDGVREHLEHLNDENTH